MLFMISPRSPFWAFLRTSCSQSGRVESDAILGLTISCRSKIVRLHEIFALAWLSLIDWLLYDSHLLRWLLITLYYLLELFQRITIYLLVLLILNWVGLTKEN